MTRSQSFFARAGPSTGRKTNQRSGQGAFKNLINVVRMTSKPSSSSRGRKQGRGNAGSPRTSYRQRCAVRVTYSGDRVRGPRPAAAEESFEIVRRRLFQPISDPDLFRARDAVVKAFAEMYRKDASEYPSQASQADYERRLKIAYPIHPDLFESLYSDWSSLERFQRTRGVLRRLVQATSANQKSLRNGSLSSRGEP